MPWLLTAIGLTLVAAVLLKRAAPKRIISRFLISPVTRQHLHLLEGGQLCAAKVEAARRDLQRRFASGGRPQSGEWLRPGLEYAAQVQALVEIGGRQAVDWLLPELHRRHVADDVEQAWYWLDVARGLRCLQPPDAMAGLLRCAALNSDTPLNHHFAAEVAGCPGFLEALDSPQLDLQTAAIRALGLALRSVRWGAAPGILADGKLGDCVVHLWRRRPPPTDPGVVTVSLEALRIAQRCDHLRLRCGQQPATVRAIEGQFEAMLSVRPALGEYLTESTGPLVERLATISDDRRLELLDLLDDLRADAASVVLPNLRDWPDDHRRRAIELLRWSPSPDVGRWLCDWTYGSIDPARRALGSSFRWPWRRRAMAEGFPYRSILRALRGQASPENETLLLIAAADRDPHFRAAALSSLGWWQPVEEWAVLRALQVGRCDRDHEVRSAAEAGLARFGERRALHSLRAALAGETERSVTDTVRFIANEHILWLWPDLDALADADDVDVALAARDALEQMRENVGGGLLVP